MRLNRMTRFAILIFVVSAILCCYSNYKRATGIDGTAPKITMDREKMVVSVHDGPEVLTEGITAYDRKDGDVTDSLMIESISNFTKEKSRTVTYAVFDSDMHVTKASRSITYSDYRSPEFSLSAPLEFRVGTTNILANLTCNDCLDGNISSFIKVIPPDSFSIATPGEYLVTFQASNSAGDTSTLQAMVVMFDSTTNRGSQISLTDYLVYLDPQQDFYPLDYLDQVVIGNRKYDIVRGAGNYNDPDRAPDEKIVVGTDMIRVDSNVNPAVPGSYRILYTMATDAGNQETVIGSRRLCVVVRGS